MPKREYVSSAIVMILGKDLIPDHVSKLLRMRPSQSWQRGELKSARSKHQWGGWKRLLPQSQQHKLLEGQIRYWCRTLQGREAAIRRLSKGKNHCVLRCYVGTSKTASIAANPALLRSIARLGLTVELALAVH